MLQRFCKGGIWRFIQSCRGLKRHTPLNRLPYIMRGIGPDDFASLAEDGLTKGDSSNYDDRIRFDGHQRHGWRATQDFLIAADVMTSASPDTTHREIVNNRRESEQ